MARTKRITVEEGSGNVFADLGFKNAEEELLRAELVLRLVQLIRGRGLSQVEAAGLLGVTQPKVSALFNGKVAGFSVERLMRLLCRLGQDVRITVRPKPRGRDRGRVMVEKAA
jgi:predicted XRE-type DNA-binding protein